MVYGKALKLCTVPGTGYCQNPQQPYVILQSIQKTKTQQQRPNTTCCSDFSGRKGGQRFISQPLTPKTHFYFGLVLRGKGATRQYTALQSIQYTALTL